MSETEVAPLSIGSVRQSGSPFSPIDVSTARKWRYLVIRTVHTTGELAQSDLLCCGKTIVLFLAIPPGAPTARRQARRGQRRKRAALGDRRGSQCSVLKSCRGRSPH